MNDDNIIDLKGRKIHVLRPANDRMSVEAFLKTWQQFAAEQGVVTCLILTVDPSGHVTWGMLPASDHDKALLALTLEDVREEIRDDVLGYEDIDPEEMEDEDGGAD